MSEQQIDEMIELSEIRRRAINHHELASSKARYCATLCRDAVAEALLCGAALNEARAHFEHGSFGEWLVDTGIPKSSAYRYMSLATSAKTREISEASSLRQAYIAAGIIEPEPEREQEPKDPVAQAERILDRLAAVLAALPPETLQAWKDRFAKIVNEPVVPITAQDASMVGDVSGRGRRGKTRPSALCDAGKGIG